MMELMTLEEAAIYLRVAKKTIYRLLARNSIPATKVGRLWRISKTSIDDWLHQNSHGIASNILVIDDDEEICSLFIDTLDGTGHSVTAVRESSKGLELVKGKDFDLVFLDLKMPEMDGAELFKQMRIARPGLPVTIITGYPDSDLVTTALSYGPFGVMSKPFRASDIMTAVNSYLRFGVQIK